MNQFKNLPHEHEKVWETYDADIGREVQAHLYERKNLYDLIGRFLQEKLRALSGQELKVLEIGAGTAIDSYILAQRFPQVGFTATDLSEKALDFARRAGEHFDRKIILEKEDAFQMKYQAETFDLVFSQGLLEHFQNVGGLMREQLRVLKDDGILIVDVPQKYTLRTIIKHRKINQGQWEWGWETQYSYGELKRLGQRYGLRVVGVCGHEYDLGFCKKLRRLPLGLKKRARFLQNRSWFEQFTQLHFTLWEWFEFHGGYFVTDSIAVAYQGK